MTPRSLVVDLYFGLVCVPTMALVVVVGYLWWKLEDWALPATPAPVTGHAPEEVPRAPTHRDFPFVVHEGMGRRVPAKRPDPS